MHLGDYIPFFDKVKRSERNKPLVDLAEVLSLVFDPFGTTLLTSLLVLYRLNISITGEKIQILIILLLALLIPITYLFYGLKTGKIKDIFISDRRERYNLLLISSGVALVFNIVLWYYQAPSLIVAYSLSALILAVAITATTFFWKISGHSSVLTLNVLTINMLLGFDYLWLLLLIPVVAWARVTLKVHTLEQVVAGAVVSAVIFFTVFSNLGLIQLA